MSFCVAIVKEPIFIWDGRRECKVLNWDENKGDHLLDFTFDGEDFDEVQKYLDLKLHSLKKHDGENYDEFHERLENEYKNAAKANGYQMLGRFWFYYDDAIYFPSEVNQLQEESLKVKKESKNPNLTKAVDKILIACKEASNTKSGIYFGSD